MKWFKLDSNFLNDTRVVELIEKNGDRGLRLYIALLCSFAQQWNGEPNKEFYVNINLIQAQSGYYHRSMLLQCMANLSLIFGLSYRNVDLNFVISYPKFLKKQASYYRGAASRATGIDKNRIEQNRTTAKPLVLSTDNANKKKKSNPVVEKLFTYFCEQYFIKHNKKYIPNYAKDKSIMKRLLSTTEEIKLAELIFDFFRSNDEFIKKSDYGIGIFSTQINKLNIQKPKVLRGNIWAYTKK